MKRATVVLALWIVACGDSGVGGSGASGDDGTAGDGGDGASTADGGAGGDVPQGGSGGDGAGGQGGDPGTPCVPLGNSSSTPTPGVCEGNAAVVCDPETATLVTQTCSASETCVEYTLTEHVFDGLDSLTWEETRTFDWAGCIPADAEPCELAFNGNYWWNSEFLSSCQGADKTYCGQPPLPEYALDTGGQLQVGTAAGYVHLVPCGPGMICREPLTGPTNQIDALGCFDEDAPACSEAYDVCDGNVHKQCDLYHGYEAAADCADDARVCMLGCGGSAGYCVSPGTTTCDPNVPFTECNTEDDFLTCANCLTASMDCSFVVWIDATGTFHNDPGECVVADDGPQCVAEGTPLCDSSAPETCVGNVARKCYGGVQYDVDCAFAGDVCMVGEGGIAGCTFAGAPTCTIGETETCSGDVLQGCCPETGVWSPAGSLPCPPGHDVRFDCKDILPAFTCIDHMGFFAECNDPNP